MALPGSRCSCLPWFSPVSPLPPPPPRVVAAEGRLRWLWFYSRFLPVQREVCLSHWRKCRLSVGLCPDETIQMADMKLRQDSNSVSAPDLHTYVLLCDVSSGKSIAAAIKVFRTPSLGATPTSAVWCQRMFGKLSPVQFLMNVDSLKFKETNIISLNMIHRGPMSNTALFPFNQ